MRGRRKSAHRNSENGVEVLGEPADVAQFAGERTIGIVLHRLHGFRQLREGTPPSFGVVRMGPAVEIHHVPEMVGGEAAEVGDDGDEHALDALLVERARQMVMVDQVVGAPEAGNDRHHVRLEEFGQILRRLRPPGVPLLIDLVHAERDLGWPKAQDRRRVENRFAKTHGSTGAHRES